MERTSFLSRLIRASSDPEQVLQDPFGERTRKERRALLGVAVTGFIVTKMGLQPTQITSLGITFGPAQYDDLLHWWGVVVVYFLIMFALYVFQDLTAFGYKGKMFARKQDLDECVGRLDKQHADYRDFNDRMSSPDLSMVSAAFAMGSSSHDGNKEYERCTMALREVQQSCARSSSWIYWSRVVFDIIVPVLVGLIAVYYLWK